MTEIDAVLEKLAAEHQVKSAYGLPKRSGRSERWLPWMFGAAMLGALTFGVVFWLRTLSFRSGAEDLKQITLDSRRASAF